MDGTEEKILDLLKRNARMSYQELGDYYGAIFLVRRHFKHIRDKTEQEMT